MGRRPPFREGMLHVAVDRCSTCVFRPGNLMRLSPGRLADLVDSNLAAEAALVCHKTIYEHDSLGEAICRGFYDAYGDRLQAVQVAQRLGLVRLQEVP